jgi:hypothetical protein
MNHLNFFAAGVIVLEFLAAIQYVRQGLWLEALLWASYGVGNLALIWIAVKRLEAM